MTTRKSARIQEKNFDQYKCIMKRLQMEVNNINGNGGYWTQQESRKYRVDHTIILYKLLYENFDYLYKYTNYPRGIENVMTIARSQITQLTTDAILLNIYTKTIDRIFTRFTKKYAAYKKAKMNNLVLITRVFPIDIVREIAQYYM